MIYTFLVIWKPHNFAIFSLFTRFILLSLYQAIAFQKSRTQIEMLQDGHYVIAGFSNSTSSLK